MEYCQDHHELVANTKVIKVIVENLDKRINGALDAVEKHISAGSRWRMTIIGISVTFLINVFIVIYWYGRMSEKVEHNAYAMEEVKQEIKLLRNK